MAFLVTVVLDTGMHFACHPLSSAAQLGNNKLCCSNALSNPLNKRILLCDNWAPCNIFGK